VLNDDFLHAFRDIAHGHVLFTLFYAASRRV
jgi:hypothetical protein